MSSLPKTPQDIKDLIAERERYLSAERKAIEKREALSEPEEIPQLMATLALARSAGADIGTPMAPQPHLIVTTAGTRLEQDGCDFIGATQVFLDLLGCPYIAREFVLTLMGLSGGNSKDLLIITDKQIAARSGQEERTIRRQRQALFEWEQAINCTMVEIHEKEYDPVTKRYRPTEYRMTLSPYISEFITDARSMSYLERGKINPGFAINEATYQGVKKLAEKHRDAMPESQLVRRLKQYNSERSQGIYDYSKSVEEKVKRVINEFYSFKSNQGCTFAEAVERLGQLFDEGSDDWASRSRQNAQKAQ
jgi:hypothetical protein